MFLNDVCSLASKSPGGNRIDFQGSLKERKRPVKAAAYKILDISFL